LTPDLPYGKLTVMKLAAYLKREAITASKLAEQIAAPPSTITRILKGERVPNLALMQRIARATNNEVSSLDDFVPPHGEAAA
jgi:transcriptional regulator with XRE-family HTH domain